jgi:hypothetical protein
MSSHPNGPALAQLQISTFATDAANLRLAPHRRGFSPLLFLPQTGSTALERLRLGGGADHASGIEVQLDRENPEERSDAFLALAEVVADAVARAAAVRLPPLASNTSLRPAVDPTAFDDGLPVSTPVFSSRSTKIPDHRRTSRPRCRPRTRHHRAPRDRSEQQTPVHFARRYWTFRQPRFRFRLDERAAQHRRGGSVIDAQHQQQQRRRPGWPLVGTRRMGLCDGYCHERESQTHLWEAPPGGPYRPFGQGVRRPQLTTERAQTGLADVSPGFACSGRPMTPWGFTSQPRRAAGVRAAGRLAPASYNDCRRPRPAGQRARASSIPVVRRRLARRSQPGEKAGATR